MLHRLLVVVALACCGLVLASFVLFARDQVASASTHQQQELAPPTSSVTPVAPAAHKATAQPRRFIDSADRTLTSPFRSLVQSSSPWVTHGVPTILALLVYGVGLGYLARFTRGMA